MELMEITPINPSLLNYEYAECRDDLTSGINVVILFFFRYFNDPSYKEMVENAAQFNSRLGAERTMRLPFLDNQTGNLVLRY